MCNKNTTPCGAQTICAGSPGGDSCWWQNLTIAQNPNNTIAQNPNGCNNFGHMYGVSKHHFIRNAQVLANTGLNIVAANPGVCDTS